MVKERVQTATISCFLKLTLGKQKFILTC